MDHVAIGQSLVSGSDVLAKNSQIVKAKGASPTFYVVISGSINTQISPNFSAEIGTVFRASHFLNEVKKINPKAAQRHY